MRCIILSTLILFCLPTFSQPIPKKANTIIVKNVSFDAVVRALLTENYVIEKVDSNYKTVRTEFKIAHTKNGRKIAPMSVYARMNDGSCFITGRWYSEAGLSQGLLKPSASPGPNDIYDVSYTWGGDKLLFEALIRFAEKFNTQIEYQKL